MKKALLILSITLCAATVAHAGEPFHHSQEAGLSVYRGTGPTYHMSHAPQPKVHTSHGTPLSVQQFHAEQRYRNAKLKIMREQAAAEARYLRHLERTDTAIIRGQAKDYDRYNSYGNSFGVIINDGPRRIPGNRGRAAR